MREPAGLVEGAHDDTGETRMRRFPTVRPHGCRGFLGEPKPVDARVVVAISLPREDSRQDEADEPGILGFLKAAQR